jgi:hypothetical protein
MAHSISNITYIIRVPHFATQSFKCFLSITESAYKGLYVIYYRQLTGGVKAQRRGDSGSDLDDFKFNSRWMSDIGAGLSPSYGFRLPVNHNFAVASHTSTTALRGIGQYHFLLSILS